MTQEAVDKLKAKLKQARVGSTSYWVVEGDLLLSDAQLAAYADGGQANAPPKPGRTPHELIAMLKDGKLVRWKVGLVLTYAIRRDSFTDVNYRLVRDCMTEATKEWEATCGVRFDRRKEDDPAVMFTVEQVDAQGEFIAAAFFPDWPKDRRKVVIDPSFYTTSFDKVGVLRHELGHVLGFRHEHIRPEAPAECPKEGMADTFPLDRYNPRSVMHYFCGGVGDKDLEITDKDREAAQRLYGPSFDFISYAE